MNQSAPKNPPMKWYGKLMVIIALIAAVIFIVEHKKQQGFTCASSVPELMTGSEMQPAVIQKISTKNPRLLDLGADKCVPCKMMAPILDELKETYKGKLDVEFIDVWKNQQAGQAYGIRMIPTQIFFDAAGNELFRHEGFFSKEDLLAKWNELGVDL